MKLGVDSVAVSDCATGLSDEYLQAAVRVLASSRDNHARAIGACGDTCDVFQRVDNGRGGVRADVPK